jgi:hypothetical protein
LPSSARAPAATRATDGSDLDVLIDVDPKARFSGLQQIVKAATGLDTEAEMRRSIEPRFAERIADDLVEIFQNASNICRHLRRSSSTSFASPNRDNDNGRRRTMRANFLNTAGFDRRQSRNPFRGVDMRIFAPVPETTPHSL